MLTTDELRKKNNDIYDSSINICNHLDGLANEANRMGSVFGNAQEIITDLDKDFSQKTGITNPKDLSLLFAATGLLCAKWLIMGQVMPLDFDFKHELTPNEDRLTDGEGDKLADDIKKNNKKYNKLSDDDKYSDDNYRTVEQIILRPVPYDAMTKSDNVKFPPNINLNGMNHRSYTMGHDPILGWVFGTVNIISRSITLKHALLPTYTVSEKGIQIEQTSNFFYEITNAWRSVSEDNKRLPAAVFKQGLHFVSDKYTKTGLPIPFLSAEKAQELIEKGWNSVEIDKAIKKFLTKSAKLVGTIAIQFTISFIINLIIKSIHLMLYNEETDGDFKLYEVRTRKILLTANVISSSSNILVSAGVAIGTKDVVAGAKLLDIGGMIETIHRLITDITFINEIKREFIINNFEKIALGYDNEFEWLFDNLEGENKYGN